MRKVEHGDEIQRECKAELQKMQNLIGTKPAIDSLDFFKTSFWGEQISEKKIARIINHHQSKREHKGDEQLQTTESN